MNNNTTIKTKRLKLRLLKDSDAIAIFNILQKYPEITKYTTFPTPQKITETEAFISQSQKDTKTEKAYEWGIFLQDELIGLVGLNKIVKREFHWEFNRANLGYWLNPEFHNQGFITEVAQEVLRFGFTKLKLNKVEAFHISNNIASQRVIEKLGFKYLCEKEKHVFFENKWWNSKIYELLAENFNKK